MAQTRRLLIIGDSIAKGVTYQDGRYRLCTEHNFDALVQKGLEVQNFAKMGACTDLGLSIVKKRLALCEEGTTAALSFGGNDCDFDWQAVSDRPQDEHLPKFPAEAFLENYRAMVRLAKDAGARVIMTSLVPLEAHRFLNFVSQGRSKENILSWLGDADRIFRWQEYYNDLVCRLARELSVPLLDVRPEFLKSPVFPSLISEDGIHPTQAGHDLLHRCAWEAVGSL